MSEPLDWRIDSLFRTAGRGIVHAEMPLHEEGMPDPEGLQLWVGGHATTRFFEWPYQ